MIVVPDNFARDTIAREGDAGREWIDALPGMVKALCDEWRLVMDGPVMHGYLGLVVPVRRVDELYVLKLSWIAEATSYEVAALMAWDGRGAVRLLDVEPSRKAMLLERLDYSRTLNDVGIEEAITVAGQLLRRLAIPAPDGIPSLKARSVDIVQNLPEQWERYGRPMSRQRLDQACELAVELGEDCTQNLLVNYDLHYADVLASQREPWLAVDPMVVAGEPEFGVAQLLWRRLEDMEAQGGLKRYFLALVENAELDPARARAWTLVRCVDYWLWGLGVGLTCDPARCEIIIDRLG